MSELGTYSLSDFLMFSPQVYWRLIARYNAAWWPAQFVALAVGLAIWWLVDRGHRAALLLLAAAWGWLAWAFFGQWYAEIFLAAQWIAAACAGQALLLVVAAAWRWPPPVPGSGRGFGVVLLTMGLLYPLLSLWSGRTTSEAEVFAFMPDPTALATLGVLLALPQLPRWWRGTLALVPVAVFALGMATRWLMA